MSREVRPFAEQGNFTVAHNVLFDHVMPRVSGNGFKVLMFVVRKTFGWHRDIEILPASRIMAGTGIGGRSTVFKAIAELEAMGILLVHRGARRGDGTQEPNCYSLDFNWVLPENGPRQPRPFSGFRANSHSPETGLCPTAQSPVSGLIERKPFTLEDGSREKPAASLSLVDKCYREPPSGSDEDDPPSDDFLTHDEIWEIG